MTRDEFDRIKTAEKAHLRALKKLKNAVRTLKRKQRVTRAVAGMTEGLDRLREQESLVESLAMETARYEARMDIALEHADAKGSLDDAERRAVAQASAATKAADDAAARAAQDDADLQAERARRLVAEMKVQLGVPATEVPVSSKTLGRTTMESVMEPGDDEATPARPATAKPSPEPPADPTTPKALPDKTIGRPRS